MHRCIALNLRASRGIIFVAARSPDPIRGALWNCETLDTPISMTLKGNPETIVLARAVDELQPFMRPAGDGTYEVVVPLTDRSLPVILPYSFSSEEDGMLWVCSPKGSKRIETARTRFE